MPKRLSKGLIRFNALVNLSFVGWLLVLCLRVLLFLIFCVIWIIAGVKAYGGQSNKLPIIGEFAWKTVYK